MFGYDGTIECVVDDAFAIVTGRFRNVGEVGEGEGKIGNAVSYQGENIDEAWVIHLYRLAQVSQNLGDLLRLMVIG